MAKVTIKGVDYEVAPFMLEQIEQSARFIDQFNDAFARANALKAEGKTQSMALIAQMAAGILGTIAVGLASTQPTMTLQKLRTEVDFQGAMALQGAFMEILREAGLIPLVATGTASAPPAARGKRSKAVSES